MSNDRDLKAPDGYQLVRKLDLIDLSFDIKAGMQRDSPLSPIETLSRLDCFVWGLISSADRKDIDRRIEDKEYLPPVHLVIEK